jgi:hypothetical protein
MDTVTTLDNHKGNLQNYTKKILRVINNLEAKAIKLPNKFKIALSPLGRTKKDDLPAHKLSIPAGLRATVSEYLVCGFELVNWY